MSTATVQQTPVVPPRPSRSQDKDQPTSNASSAPIVPPRPSKRFNRSVSPNPARFAPSPLNESPFHPRNSEAARSSLHLGHGTDDDPINRSSSVNPPTVGEEGWEYEAVTEELRSSPKSDRRLSSSPEQTRTVGDDVKLHAPKPQMPAQSAKQRVATVTRTDSDRAAAFGIGRPRSEEPVASNRSLKKKSSTLSQLSNSEAHEDEHGIPEIGQRVPMYPNAGDVQAPSPAPGASGNTEVPSQNRNHHRKGSSRGFVDAPPGSYGLHGHSHQLPQDKLERAYYQKHPELAQKEHYNPRDDRANDFSLSSEELNKIVRDTASRGAGFGTGANYISTPSEQVGFQASDEYTSRKSSPRPPSAAARHSETHISSPLKRSSFPYPEISISGTAIEDDDGTIHVEEQDHSKGFVKYGDEESASRVEVPEERYSAPILASDEVARTPAIYDSQPAVPPPAERRGSSYEMEEPRSRPNSRPASIYSPPSADVRSTPLEDVEEYEPLFTEDEQRDAKAQAQKLKEFRQRFPSRDIWEDAPHSAHATAEVSTPQLPQELAKEQRRSIEVPPRDTETPAQAFARRQEELAEKEARTPDSFLHRQQKPPGWVQSQPHLQSETDSRPSINKRFPSRDIWEDTPDSHHLQATVSTPQQAEDENEAVQSVVPENPSVPTRLKPRQGSGDDTKPNISDRPKPQVPARPAKQNVDIDTSAKQKPAVPARPVGSKIAALQAGFMADLNKRLQVGPQAPKKEDASPVEDLTEEKVVAPLPDARKGRARGPQRRAPTTGSSSNGPPSTSRERPTLGFSAPCTLWSIDEEGSLSVDAKLLSDPTVNAAQQDSLNIEKGDRDQKELPELHKSSGGPDQETQSQESPKTVKQNTEETKIVAANLAGESILEETVEKDKSGNEVEAVEDVDEVVKS